MLPLIRSGYDFEADFLVTLDGTTEDISTYTFVACVVDERKRVKILDDAPAAAVGGTTGAVRVTFTSGNTSGMSQLQFGNGQQANGAYQRKAYLELAIITSAGKRLPVSHCEVTVELGWAGVA